MKKHWVPIIILMILVSNAWGQTYLSFNEQIDQIRETTRFRIGPFRLFPRILGRELGYDSNIYRQAYPISDFTFTIAPELGTYVLAGDSLILSFFYMPEYVFYRDTEELTGWNITYSPEIKWRLTFFSDDNLSSSSIK